MELFAALFENATATSHVLFPFQFQKHICDRHVYEIRLTTRDVIKEGWGR
jgi:hypothetical protein